MSNFFVTINSNRSDPEVVELLKSAYNGFVKNIFEFLKYPGGTDQRDKIQKIDIDTALEQGSIKKRYHIHAYIKIQHKTKLQINMSKCRNYFKERLGGGIHFDVKFIRQKDFCLISYLKKNPIE